MELLERTEDFKLHGGESTVTIGVFDGVHRGHQRIISECVRDARKRRIPAVVLTFERNPREVISGESPCVITAPQRKIAILEELGVDFTIPMRFSRRFASLEPDRFCRLILEGHLGAREVCVGENFRFGSGGKGDVALLARQGEILGFQVDVVPLVSVGGEQLSSTLIRGLVSEGRMSEVAQGLGRPYTVTGRVVKGHSRGKSMGFPTANLALERDFCVPADGVYGGKAILGQSRYLSAINIGSNPTFCDEEVALEVFLIDFEGDIYGESLEVEFHHRLRREVAFSGEKELARQIQNDVEKVRSLL
ncbi:MAG: bifunctional riboflavin kinase/FAD synthetase [Actinobacteria bacterium]|nr:bifunctional riboflavin kinase/FAD synthetase [Actinomycetota bacterium]